MAQVDRRRREKAERRAKELRERRKKAVRKLTRSASPRPSITILAAADGRFAFELIRAPEIVEKIGLETFSAFMKCFVGIDHVVSIQQLYRLNRAHVPVDTIGHVRNWRRLIFSIASAVYELGDAINELSQTKVYSKMRDKTKWTKLNEIRARWYKNPKLGIMRNQIGYHLGDLDTYKRGVTGAISRRRVFLAKGHRELPDDVLTDTMFDVSWETLFAGLTLEDSDMKLFEELIPHSFELGDLLGYAFVEVLRSAGINARKLNVERLPGEALPETHPDYVNPASSAG